MNHTEEAIARRLLAEIAISQELAASEPKASYDSIRERIRAYGELMEAVRFRVSLEPKRGWLRRIIGL